MTSAERQEVLNRTLRLTILSDTESEGTDDTMRNFLFVNQFDTGLCLTVMQLPVDGWVIAGLGVLVTRIT